MAEASHDRHIQTSPDVSRLEYYALSARGRLAGQARRQTVAAPGRNLRWSRLEDTLRFCQSQTLMTGLNGKGSPPATMLSRVAG